MSLDLNGCTYIKGLTNVIPAESHITRSGIGNLIRPGHKRTIEMFGVIAIHVVLVGLVIGTILMRGKKKTWLGVFGIPMHVPPTHGHLHLNVAP